MGQNTPHKIAPWYAGSKGMSARFEAEAAILVRGRGLVLLGRVVAGVVKPGMSLCIPSFPVRLVVQGFEHVTLQPKARVAPGIIGLRFALCGEAEQAAWKNLNVRGKVFTVYFVQ